MSETHMVKLGDVCDIIIGRTPARKDPSFWGGELPWLSIADMNQGRNITQTKEKITNAGTGKGKIILPGTVLLSFKLSIGKVGINTIPLYTNEAIAALPIKKPSLIYPEYLACFLESQNFDSLGNRAAMGKTLNKKSLQELEIPLPSLEEQKRIVNILDKARSIQEARQKQLAALDELAISIFSEHFTDKSYPAKPIGEVAKVIAGGTPRSSINEYWNGDIEWATPADLGKHSGMYFSSSSRKITQAGLENSSAILLPSGSVLMSSRAPIGHLAINTVPMATNQGCKNIIPGEKLNSIYLFFWLKNNMSYIQNLGVGATFKEISKKTVANINIPIPPLEKQLDFAKNIENLEKINVTLSWNKEKTNSLLDSIQSLLFK